MALVLGSCGFSPAQIDTDGGEGVDAADTCGAAASTTCTGRTRRTCGADHRWDSAADKLCDYTCSEGTCVAASNVPLTDVVTCTADAPALTPAAGSTVSLSASGGTHIDCSPNCGTVGVTRINAVKTYATPLPGFSLFCLSKIELQGATQLLVATNTVPPEAILMVVDDAVSIAGIISFDGAGAGSGAAVASGGPGGFAGADLSTNSGHDGQGPCRGHGGTTSGPQFTGNDYSGGGGGGAGNASIGGDGGTGECVDGDHHGGPGMHGGLCGTDELIPLIGGSGGGGGGDATINGAYGYGGGGGGGVLQISSRTSIAVTGSISARGGAGFGTATVDGGSGGGAGGGLLLEAPAILLTGQLSVDGGNGGLAGAGAGGTGASGGNQAANGRSHTANGQGGTGGGGGGGRIRIVGGNATCTSGVSPNTACTTGALVVAP